MLEPTLYLLRLGEVALKKRNRNRFINDLVKIVKARVAPLGGKIDVRHKKLLLRCTAPAEQVRAALSTVYGLAGISPIWRTDHSMEKLCEVAWSLMLPHVGSGKTFAVKARRAMKNFPFSSTEIGSEVAGYMFDRGLDLPVDLKHATLSLGIYVELAEIWIYLESWPGLGGLPVRITDKYGLLLSGGIDSPVAGNMMQKRGAWLTCIYFHTPPYTVEAAREKVYDLAQVLARYQNTLWLHVVNFTEIMQTLRAECEEGYTVILGRRMMLRAANAIMNRLHGKGLITGECLGQVASQTIENMTAVDRASQMLVLRPLMGMDKSEIMARAEKLGTFDISIRPFVDCCSLFSPKEPVTKARLHLVEKDEARIDMAGLLERALNSVEQIQIQPNFAPPSSEETT